MKRDSSVAKGKCVLTAIVMGMAAILSLPAQAQTFSVLHNFSGGNDGGGPLAGFVVDAAVQNAYGTTNAGGKYEQGVVFRFSQHGETVLHQFTGGADGGNPQASLIMDAAGNLYGTTNAGGSHGFGVVYKLTSKGETVLYNFAGGTDGANPQARLVMDASGNLYGTTAAGGAYSLGTAFEISGTSETVLHSFGQGTDGAVPVSGLTLDASGNLYGTASVGGAGGYGTVFQLTNSGSGWSEITLHDFALGSDGGTPYGGLVMDKSGNLFGTSTQGGEADGGGGAIFELSLANGSWTFSTVYDLDGWGISGTFRDLLLDAAGNIYGTTHCDGANDAGTVYKLTPSNGVYSYTSLYVFTGGKDGQYSFSNLVSDKHGNLYGTMNGGGVKGDGVIFMVKP